METRETPTFVYIQSLKSTTKNLLRRNEDDTPKLSFSYYHGFMGVEDDLPVWISMQTGSRIINKNIIPFRKRFGWFLFHFVIQKSELFIALFGPALFGILIAIFILSFFMSVAFFWDRFCDFANTAMKKVLSGSLKSMGRPKLDGKIKEV